MAGTSTIASRVPLKDYQQSRVGERITINWVADSSDGSVPDLTIPDIRGMVTIIQTNPGSTAPTDNYDLQLVPSTDTGLDILGGALSNRDTSSSEAVYPGVVLNGTYILKLSNNSVNSATGQVVIDVHRVNAPSTLLTYPTIATGGSAGRVPYFSGSTALKGEAAFAYDESTNILTVDAVDAEVVGTTTNDNATAGRVGQYEQSINSTDSAYSGATGDYVDLTTISLTAGDWDVDASASFYNANAAGLVEVLIGISTGSAGNSFADRANGVNVDVSNVVVGNGLVDSRRVSAYRLSLNATTTVRLKAELQFSAGTPRVTGYKLCARRVR